MFYFIPANQAVLTASVLYSSICVLFGEYDTSNWILQFPIYTPFNKSTVIGWYCEWFIQFIIGASYASYMSTITSFFVCCCFYIMTLCNHFDALCQLLKNDVQGKNSFGNGHQFHKRIHKIISKAIEIHVTTIE